MAESALPRRIVKETQRLLSEPGTLAPQNAAAFSHAASQWMPCRNSAPTSALCARLLAAPGIAAQPFTNNLRYFNVIISGPSNSPYEGARASGFTHSMPHA